MSIMNHGQSPRFLSSITLISECEMSISMIDPNFRERTDGKEREDEASVEVEVELKTIKVGLKNKEGGGRVRESLGGWMYFEN